MNIQQMMKQAQAMQKKMLDVQNEMESKEVTGVAGGGLVSIVATVKGIVKKINIDKSLLAPEEKEMLEDLIIAAFADAKKKSDDLLGDAMSGMGLPPEIMKMVG